VWENTFVAVSVLVGGVVDDAEAALEPEGAARAADMLGKLRDPRKLARAQALAAAAQDVARAIGEVTLR
jgi:hypothetical protein